MKITIELDAVSVARLKSLTEKWDHPYSDGLETECEVLLRIAISEKFWEMNKCENNSKPISSTCPTETLS